MSLVDTEQVLVVPTLEFHRLGHFQGISPMSSVTWIAFCHLKSSATDRGGTWSKIPASNS